MRLGDSLRSVCASLAASGLPLSVLDCPLKGAAKKGCQGLYTAMESLMASAEYNRTDDNSFPEVSRQEKLVNVLLHHELTVFQALKASTTSFIGKVLGRRNRGPATNAVGQKVAVLAAVLRYPFSAEDKFVDWFVAAFGQLLEAVSATVFSAVGAENRPQRFVMCAQRHGTLGCEGDLRPDVVVTRSPVSLRAVGGAMVLFFGEAKLGSIESADALGQTHQYGDEVMESQPFRTALNAFLFNPVAMVFVQFTRGKSSVESGDGVPVVISQRSAKRPWSAALAPLLAMLLNAVGSDSPMLPEDLVVNGRLHTCSTLIGQGVSSYAYSTVVHDDAQKAAILTDVVVKVAKTIGAAEGPRRAFKNEKRVLQLLKERGVPGVPRVIKSGELTLLTKGSSTPYLLLQGRCEEFSSSVPFTLPRAMELAETLYHMYTLGLVHCDVRHVNIMYHAATKRTCLIDFGFAQRLHGPQDDGFSGTLKCASPKVLAAICGGDFDILHAAYRRHQWMPQDDWHSWLRTSILMSYPQVKAALDARVVMPTPGPRFMSDLKTAASVVDVFWADLFAANPHTFGTANMRLWDMLLEHLTPCAPAGAHAPARFPPEVAAACHAILLCFMVTIPVRAFSRARAVVVT